MVASARAMFAELLVWLADPARSVAPHFEGAHFSSRGLSETGPFSVCATANPAKLSRIAISPAMRMMECLIDISSLWMVGGQAARSRCRHGDLVGAAGGGGASALDIACGKCHRDLGRRPWPSASVLAQRYRLRHAIRIPGSAG